MKGAATRQAAVERARQAAANILKSINDPAWAFARDSWWHDEHVRGYVRLALQDYRFRHPACPAKQTWLFYDGNPATTTIRVGRFGRGTPDRVDVYCLFCRELLVNPATWGHDYTYDPRVGEHTVTCALRSLAGLITPGAPGTYRLPGVLDGRDG